MDAFMTKLCPCIPKSSASVPAPSPEEREYAALFSKRSIDTGVEKSAQQEQDRRSTQAREKAQTLARQQSTVAKQVAATTPPPEQPQAPPITQASLASHSPKELLDKITSLTQEYRANGGTAGTQAVEMCFKELRVRCRDDRTCDECDRLGANEVIIQSMRNHIDSVNVLTQASAVLINLCAGDSFERRDRARTGGALAAIIEAMGKHPASPILQEMSFVALQNICFGSDVNGNDRKKAAVDAGALPAIVNAMNKHLQVDSLIEQGASTLRLLVGKNKEYKQGALAHGAQADWLKTGGFMSFRTPSPFKSSRKSKAG